MILGTKQRDAAAFGRGVILKEVVAQPLFDVAPLRRRQRSAARDQQIKFPQRSKLGVAPLQQAPQRCRHQKQAGSVGFFHRSDQIERPIGRRMHNDRSAAEQNRHRKRAAAAEIKRRRRYEAVPPVQAEIDPMRHEAAKKMLVRNQRAFGTPGGARGERQQQRRVAARRKAARQRQPFDVREPIAVHSFRSDIRRQRVAPLAQRKARTEMPRDALLFDGGPATIHRQDHKSCPRQPVQDAQMQAGVTQGDADDGVRR